MLLVPSVNSAIHDRFHLLAFAPARPVWIGPFKDFSFYSGKESLVKRATTWDGSSPSVEFLRALGSQSGVSVW